MRCSTSQGRGVCVSVVYVLCVYVTGMCAQCVCVYACERVTASRKCRPLQGWPGSCHRGQGALPAQEQGAGGGAF